MTYPICSWDSSARCAPCEGNGKWSSSTAHEDGIELRLAKEQVFGAGYAGPSRALQSSFIDLDYPVATGVSDRLTRWREIQVPAPNLAA